MKRSRLFERTSSAFCGGGIVDVCRPQAAEHEDETSRLFPMLASESLRRKTCQLSAKFCSSKLQVWSGPAVASVIHVLPSDMGSTKSDVDLGCGFRLNVGSGENLLIPKQVVAGDVRDFITNSMNGGLEIIDKFQDSLELVKVEAKISVAYQCFRGEAEGSFFNEERAHFQKCFSCVQMHALLPLQGADETSTGTDGLVRPVAKRPL